MHRSWEQHSRMFERQFVNTIVQNMDFVILLHEPACVIHFGCLQYSTSGASMKQIVVSTTLFSYNLDQKQWRSIDWKSFLPDGISSFEKLIK